MCGRFVLDRQTADLVTLFDVDTFGDRLPEPSWNISPTQTISIVLDSLPKATEAEPYPEPLRRLEAARWGLVPGSARNASDADPPLITARSEDVANQPSFAVAVAKRRAVVPASGYYEWTSIEGARVPHYVSLPGDELLVFAGLFDWWRNPAASENDPARWLLSATILTRPASGSLAGLGERMPVFLDADMVEGWLDPEEEGSQELVDEVASAAEEVAERIEFHRVGAEIDSVSSSGEQLIRAID
jgi:putative SOS response-associated peptidase YedK